MAQIKIADIKSSLIEQLEKKGADIDCYKDLVDAYIFYTKMERKMQADVQKKGLTYESISSTGKNYVKDNPSVKNAVYYNKQRLAILTQMGLNLKTVETETDDEL